VIPETADAYVAVLGAQGARGIEAVLTYVALRLEPLMVQALAGPHAVVLDVASMAKHVVLFVAVITAHSGLAPLVIPVLETVELTWTYDMLFLVLAIIPTAVIAIRMYGNFDEVASLIASHLSASEDADGRNESEHSTTY
jgi:hypothetical protein